MVTIAPLPDWKDLKLIIKKAKYINENIWTKDDCISFYTSRSAISIQLILEWYLDSVNNEYVSLWVPDFFCNETLKNIKNNNNVKILYYPIDSNLNPKWDICKGLVKDSKPDIMILVHYFGIESNIDKARAFCNINSCFLVEDCAHVLYPSEKIGKYGDFILFSPHKTLALPDGAILNINIHNTIFINRLDDIKNYFSNLASSLDDNGEQLTWILKRYIQKVVSYKKPTNYTSKIHWGKDNDSIYPKKKMSKTSRKLLSKYNIKVLRNIGYRRNKNLDMMNYLISLEDSRIKVIIEPDESYPPYLGVYSLCDIDNKEEVVDRLQNKGFVISGWPDVPPEFKNNIEGHEDALELSKNIFTVSIHQSIKQQELIRKYANKQLSESCGEIEFEWNKIDKETWESLYSSINKTNITQDWNYGDAKSSIENWKVTRGVIFYNSTMVGLVQALQKKIFGIPCITRINRGPLLFNTNDAPILKVQIIRNLKKVFKIMSIAPAIDNSSEILQYLTLSGFHKLNKYNDYSSVIDLKLDEESLQKQLKSKWRNQLKKAEKSNLIIKEWNQNYDKILELYQKNMIEKNFKGISIELLKFLILKKCLYTLAIYSQKQDLLAFDVAYIHGNTATYLIGWNNEEGRTLNTNNLLLFNIVLKMKNLGIRYFDLGGIDYINTEDIAKFKRGIGGTEYEMIGEYYSL